MCKWNLHKFAEALAPALPLSDSTAALEKYDGLFKGYYEEGMRRFDDLKPANSCCTFLQQLLWCLFASVCCDCLPLRYFCTGENQELMESAKYMLRFGSLPTVWM